MCFSHFPNLIYCFPSQSNIKQMWWHPVVPQRPALKQQYEAFWPWNNNFKTILTLEWVVTGLCSQPLNSPVACFKTKTLHILVKYSFIFIIFYGGNVLWFSLRCSATARLRLCDSRRFLKVTWRLPAAAAGSVKVLPHYQRRFGSVADGGPAPEWKPEPELSECTM